MNKLNRRSASGLPTLMLIGLLGVFQSHAANRISIINMMESGSVDVVLTSSSGEFSAVLGAGESTGYVELSGELLTLNALESGQPIASVSIDIPDATDWTYVLSTEQTAEADLNWFALPDHNHPIDTFSFQVAHLSRNRGMVRFTNRCESTQRTASSSTSGVFGLGGVMTPALDIPIFNTHTAALTCEITAFDNRDNPIATTRSFDSFNDAGHVFRVILGNDDSDGPRLLTFLQEIRPTDHYKRPDPADSGLYFSPRQAGSGWALLADEEEVSAMYFGYDADGEPIWGSSVKTLPFGRGDPFTLFFEQYRQREDGLLTRTVVRRPVDIAVHGCGHMTAFGISLPDPLTRDGALPEFPQDALPLQSIYPHNCMEGEQR